MTGEFEITRISTGTWWSSPTNSTAALFSGYSLQRPTEISIDITDFGWQNFDNKINDRNDDLMNMHNSFFDGLFDPNEQMLSDSWPKTTIPDAKSELLESFSFLDNTFLIDSEAESFLDHEIRNHKSKEQITQDSNNLTSKKNEEMEENNDEYSPRLLKRSRIDTLSPLPSFKVRKEKLGDRITALQQLVSPFGKTDTASVLNEAVEYIKFLQEQVTMLSNPDQNTIGSVQRQQFPDKKSINTQEEEECRRHLAWDTCRDRFAILESVLPQRMPMIPKSGSSRKAKEAAAAAAQAAAAANAASSASVQVRILLDDGTSNILMRSVGGRSEPVIGLHGGALLGIGYRTSRRISPVSATAISTIQSMPLSGFGNSNVSSFSSYDDGSSQRSADSAPLNYQLYSWENFEPVGGMLPQPEWTAWDQTVEYCAFAYQQYMVISSLRPQYRYLGDVAISHATGAVWHRRQLFVATPTTIECVFVDAGVSEIDIETRKMKEEMKLKEAQARAVAEHGELALITVEGTQSAKQERISLRPPMLQVVRLASFQNAPSVPPFLSLPRQSRGDGDDMDERRINEVAVGGGGVSVAVTRFPVEQKRPVGPLVVAGVRDGVLWLIDRYMCAHAISLNHPGIRCRCLAAYGDAVSAVKWASRLGREHHDDLAQFMLGMGYATEALHLPGISKRLEFDLAMQSNDLKRALHCLLTMSNSKDIGQDGVGLELSDILSLTAEKKEDVVEAVEGIVKFAKEFLELIDAADATGHADIAREALKRLATAGSVKGALQGHELRGLALRLANHGELTRLSGLINNLISIGLGRESAFSAAVLGDNALMEKAWQDTGMLAEAVLHAHAHGRPTLKNLVQAWNKTLHKEVEQAPSSKTDAASAFLASLEDPKLTSLSDASKKPPIEILPPGMSSIFASISAPKKPLLTQKTAQPEPTKPLAIEEPAKPLAIEAPPSSEPPQTESAPETAAVSETAAPETTAVEESTAPETAAVDESAAPVDGPVTETVSEPPVVEKEETSLEDKSNPSSTPNTETAVATEDNNQATPPPPPPPPETVRPIENAATERQQVTYPPIRSQPIDFDFLNG